MSRKPRKRPSLSKRRRQKARLEREQQQLQAAVQQEQQGQTQQNTLAGRPRKDAHEGNGRHGDGSKSTGSLLFPDHGPSPGHAGHSGDHKHKQRKYRNRSDKRQRRQREHADTQHSPPSSTTKTPKADGTTTAPPGIASSSHSGTVAPAIHSAADSGVRGPLHNALERWQANNEMVSRKANRDIVDILRFARVDGSSVLSETEVLAILRGALPMFHDAIRGKNSREYKRLMNVLTALAKLEQSDAPQHDAQLHLHAHVSPQEQAAELERKLLDLATVQGITLPTVVIEPESKV